MALHPRGSVGRHYWSIVCDLYYFAASTGEPVSRGFGTITCCYSAIVSSRRGFVRSTIVMKGSVCLSRAQDATNTACSKAEALARQIWQCQGGYASISRARWRGVLGAYLRTRISSNARCILLSRSPHYIAQSSRELHIECRKSKRLFLLEGP
jgi:hypothetical protein